MKQKLILIILIIFFFINHHLIFANTINELQMRLNKTKSFYIFFTQKISDINGTIIQYGKGELWIKYPFFFKWHIFSPDNIWLISDCINLWFYNPLIKQVSIFLLSNEIKNTPLMLLVLNDPKIWKKYKIIKNNNTFVLSSIQKKENILFFSITIQHNGNIKNLKIIEKNGQTNTYYFKNQNIINIKNNLFHFIPPKNVTIDDQRETK